MDFKEIVFEGLVWTHLIRPESNSKQLPAAMDVVKKHQFP
jgi:hypothetical protein